MWPYVNSFPNAFIIFETFHKSKMSIFIKQSNSLFYLPYMTPWASLVKLINHTNLRLQKLKSTEQGRCATDTISIKSKLNFVTILTNHAVIIFQNCETKVLTDSKLSPVQPTEAVSTGRPTARRRWSLRGNTEP